MIALECPIPGCSYKTPESSETVACALLTAHTPVHTSVSAMATSTRNHGPKLDRPKVDVGINQEEWNIFIRRWDAFVIGSGLDPDASSSQLFQCAGEDLGNSLLKSDPDIISRPTSAVKNAMKSLAVIAVATGVTRSELMAMQQERDESFRSFAARVRGKAETCSYITKCDCERSVDFTDIIIRDVLLAGIADMDIRREALGTDGILGRSINDVVSLVEGKEMARNALPTIAASISNHRHQQLSPQPTNQRPTDKIQTSSCPDCGNQYALFSEGPRGLNKRPHRQCLNCYRSKRNRNKQNQKTRTGNIPKQNEIGGVFAQVTSISTNTNTNRTADTKLKSSTVNPSHHVFSKGQWRRARFLNHPEIKLSVSATKNDYLAFGRKCPDVAPTIISAMADSGAQSCLWSLNDFYAAGFSKKHLIPVNMDLVAANKSPIKIDGAVLLRLNGLSSNGMQLSCACMTYISQQAKGFYLSREAMMDLGIVSKDFPMVGAVPERPDPLQYPSRLSYSREARNLNAGCSITLSDESSSCSCPERTVVPEPPTKLPFDCSEANNAKMEKWLLEYFGSSTFNTCSHQPLPSMVGPPVEIHISDDAVPKAVHTPAPVPIHWQDQVKADLLRDEALGVIENVPYGEPVTWCHRMVVTRKHNGSPRRTVDLSPLNKHCKRETFANESPFHLARRVPPDTWKTVTDAWNGYHSVPLRESDRHLTTFISPFGRWRYKRAPQGFLSSGDGYNRRFDAVLSDFERKERCVDDTIHYDSDLEEHWWRTIEFLITVGNSGIVLNPDKFQFARKEVDFAGFRISSTSIEPLPKFLDAIRNFPTPKSITDIRSWFGLVNQVSNYAQLRDLMAPFKQFLSPKCTFNWTTELDNAFTTSKRCIVDSIKHGVEIFDPHRRTCLRPDWSKNGIGYILIQKHCTCLSDLPDCCEDGWKIALAGSRFLSAAEQRYAPIEGEALAVAWGLEQTKYFTQGCNDLLIVTDHKPLVKILGDRTLDEISNSRIFRLKQRTLPWSFTIAHLPGKTNSAADAASRYPSASAHMNDDAECIMAAAIHKDANTITSLSWEQIATATTSDPTMKLLVEAIECGFPDEYRTSDPGVSKYWQYRESLHVSEGVVMYRDRAVIPKSLRAIVLKFLHSAHQGVTSMQSRAKSIVFWPGMTQEIQFMRNNCHTCNKNAPSQPRPPATEQVTPSTPFESIFADYFTHGGHHYLVAGDRLSGWVEMFRAPHGTSQAGADGLIASFKIPIFDIRRAQRKLSQRWWTGIPSHLRLKTS